MRIPIKPPLFKDEKIILSNQGCYINNLRSGWKIGYLYLTDLRIIFFQPVGIVFEAPLSDIVDINLEKRKFGFGRKNTICLSYLNQNKQAVKAWIVMSDLDNWRRKILELSLVKVDEKALHKVAEKLDADSQSILFYLWENKHARIEELSELINASEHMGVLLKIKKVINPICEKIAGFPFLKFEKVRVDPETGEKILFSWWLNGVKEELRKTHADILDEGDYLNVIMDLRGINEEDIQIKVVENKLSVSIETREKEYHEEISLPAEVKVGEINKKYNNGIMQIMLEKAKI